MHSSYPPQLSPFVAEDMPKTARNEQTDMPEVYPKRLTGEDYLRAWKLMGGHDIVNKDLSAENSQPRRNMPVPFEEKPATKA